MISHYLCILLDLYRIQFFDDGYHTSCAAVHTKNPSMIGEYAICMLKMELGLDLLGKSFFIV